MCPSCKQRTMEEIEENGTPQSFEGILMIPEERVPMLYHGVDFSTSSANHGRDRWSCAVGPSCATGRERHP